MSRIDLGPRYGYLKKLGSGGMGSVFLVRDSYLGKELALKLLTNPLASTNEVEEFQREFSLLSRLEHPGIARAYDFGYLGRRPYFTTNGRGTQRRRTIFRARGAKAIPRWRVLSPILPRRRCGR